MAKTKKTPFDLYDKEYFVEDLNEWHYTFCNNRDL